MTAPRPRSTTSDLETKRADRKRDETFDRRCERCDRPSTGSSPESESAEGIRADPPVLRDAGVRRSLVRTSGVWYTPGPRLADESVPLTSSASPESTPA